MKTVTASAPGRIDFLGGVADYSGSLVLEMPLSLETRVTISEIAGNQHVVVSAQEGRYELPAVALGEFTSVPRWARYSLGCLDLFTKEQRWKPKTALKFTIASRVPTSMGVSSSAALEVATMRALEKLSGRRFKGTALARLAQRAENEVVGAPCGLMDQLASAHGVRGSLLPILCRPDTLSAPVRLPAGLIAVGWPSGVKHAVTASPYATARTSAFMGRKLVETAQRRKLAHATELAPSEVRALPESILPASIKGAVFLKRCRQIDDPLSTVAPSQTYAVRAGLLFPVEENFRAHAAVELLRGNRASREPMLRVLGELLYQSHAGYSSIGLSCPETDEMVEAVRKLGPSRGFYGARVSGGGSGGTVVVLLKRSSLASLRRLASRVRFSDQTPALLA